jgi:AraC family transcriptional regulator
MGEFTLTKTAYPPHFRLSQHAHEMACLGVMFRGCLSEGFSVRKLAYSTGDAFFRPPQVMHEDRVDAAGASCFNLEVSARWLENVQEYGRTPTDPVTFGTGALQRLMYQLYQQWKYVDDVMPLMIEGLACELTAELFRTLPVKLEAQTPHWLKDAREFVQSRFADSFSLAEIAQEVGRHPVHVAREFRRYFGRTIGQLKRECRINFACEKLAHSELSIIDIALEAGFTQQAHFSTVFRRMTRRTPGEYKALYGASNRKSL